MQLREDSHYRIEGSFVVPTVMLRPVEFQGRLMPGPGGTLQGRMADRYGVSTLRGTWNSLSGGNIQFVKEYDKTFERLYHGGSEAAITYELQAAESGGWTGWWKMGQPDGHRRGQVILAIVEWDDAYPISSDLREYLELTRP